MTDECDPKMPRSAFAQQRIRRQGNSAPFADVDDARVDHVAVKQNLASTRADSDELLAVWIRGDDHQLRRLPGSKRAYRTVVAPSDQCDGYGRYGDAVQLVRNPSRTARAVQPETATDTATRTTALLERSGERLCMTAFPGDRYGTRESGKRPAKISKETCAGNKARALLQ